MTATLTGIKPGDRSASRGFDREDRYTVTYIVETTDKLDGPKLAQEAFGVPRIGEVYHSGNDFHATAIATEIEVRETDSPFAYEIEVTFNTQPPVINNTGAIELPEPPESPLDEPPKRRLRFRTRKKRTDLYYSDPANPPAGGAFDAAITLFNGEPHFIEVDYDEPILVITKNLLSIDPIVQMRLSNVVNSVPIAGAEARQLKLGGFETEELWHKAIGFYVNVHYEVIFQHETWDFQVPQIGSYYLEDLGASQIVKYYPDFAHREKVVLSTTGGFLGLAAGGIEPEVLSVRYYREYDFSSLGIL